MGQQVSFSVLSSQDCCVQSQMHVTLWIGRLCMSFKREKQQYVLLRQNNKLTELNKFDRIKKRFNNGLTRFNNLDGKVHPVNY